MLYHGKTRGGFASVCGGRRRHRPTHDAGSRRLEPAAAPGCHVFDGKAVRRFNPLDHARETQVSQEPVHQLNYKARGNPAVARKREVATSVLVHQELCMDAAHHFITSDEEQLLVPSQATNALARQRRRQETRLRVTDRCWGLFIFFPYCPRGLRFPLGVDVEGGWRRKP